MEEIKIEEIRDALKTCAELFPEKENAVICTVGFLIAKRMDSINKSLIDIKNQITSK